MFNDRRTSSIQFNSIQFNLINSPVTSAVDSDTACEDVTDTLDETEEDSTDTLEDSGARDTLIEASNDIVAVGVSVDDGAVDAVVGVGASVSMDVVVL